MRGTLQAVFDSALARVAALLLALTLAPAAFAQNARRQTRDGRRATPSLINAPAAQTRARAGETGARTVETRQGVEETGVQPDLSITAHVTANYLRFEKVPNPKVEFTGQPRRETVWQSERENLPQQVQPGVTYRNIGITLRITSVFADIDRIVAEALGEVPTSDDAQPQATSPTQTDAQTEAQPHATSDTQESGSAQTSSPAKAPTRVAARVRAERRGRRR